MALCLLLTSSPTAQAAAPAGRLPTCSWDKPGANPYQGELAAAVDRYTDIPAATRAALKARMAEQRYDDIAVIGRDHITGRYRYGELRDMHFGTGRVCKTVTRQRWPAQAQERGLVYCEAGQCIIVPTVCRNVSRVTRQAAVAAQGAAARDSGAPRTQALAVAPENTELLFEAPSAGRALGAPGEALTLAGPEAMDVLGASPAGALGGLPGGPVTLAGAAPAADPGTEAVPAGVNLASTQPMDLNGNGSFADTALGNRTVGDGQTNAGPALPLSPVPPASALGGSSFVPQTTPDATAPVPEPASAALMALGLAVLARHAARRRARPQQPPVRAQ